MASFKELKNKLTKTENPKNQLTEDNEIKISSVFELEEARYMLNLIANTDFKGRDVQVVYNIALKLQDILSKQASE